MKNFDENKLNENIIIFPCSSKEAQEHYENTIQNKISKNEIKKYQKSFENSFDIENFSVWGLRNSKKLNNIYNKINEGDIIIFYKNKKFFSWAKVAEKFKNNELAKKLWKSDKEGNSWSNIILLKDLENFKTQISVEYFNEVMSYKKNNIIQGCIILKSAHKKIAELFKEIYEEKTFYEEWINFINEEIKGYFILDTQEFKVAENRYKNDIKYIQYEYNNKINNQLKKGSVFLYRNPKRTSKNKLFYFFGGGFVKELIKKENGLTYAILENCFSFEKNIDQNNLKLSKIVWTSKNKINESWGKNFWNQYGINKITAKEFEAICSGEKIILINDTKDIEKITTDVTNETKKNSFLVEKDYQDYKVWKTVRAEQKDLRTHLFKDKVHEFCGICGQEFEIKHLVAAHIKKREKCSIEEKKDIKNIAMPMCLYGCDTSFEKGEIVVNNKGKIEINFKKSNPSEKTKEYLKILKDKKIINYNLKNKEYFKFHYNFWKNK